MTKPKTVAEYIAAAPKERQKKLREMRAILKKAAPGAKEELKWGAPVFSLHRILFAYAAFKKTVNLMSTRSSLTAVAKEAAQYREGKFALKFPLDKPLPKTLITKIAKARVKELKERDVRWM